MGFHLNMKTHIINNKSINFSGIKLSKYDEKTLKRIHRYLQINGFECSGWKTYYANNSFKDKQNKINDIRGKYYFLNNEYGIINFPWSREYYLVSEPCYEQKLLEWVNEMDNKASINLLM